MALVPFLLENLIEVRKFLPEHIQMLCAGYPDLLVDEATVRRHIGQGELTYHPDEEAIVRWHNCAHVTTRIVDSFFFFSRLGVDLSVIDITRARGNEIIHDLNFPLPDTVNTRYDMVLDTGTVEHCFNAGQAAINLASLVKKDGYIVQMLPLNSYNHGFYNMNPTWFHDFYPFNGFEIVMCTGVSNFFQPRFFEVPAFKRFTGIPENSVILIVAKRVEDKTMGFPMQHKYRINQHLKG